MNHPDEVIVARAIENGWEQVDDVYRFGGDHKRSGWRRDGAGIPIGHYEGPRWEGEWPNQVKTDGPYEVTWADAMRTAFDHDDRCEDCGKWIEYRYMSMRRPERFCWHCKFWLERVEAIAKDLSAPGMRPRTRPFVAQTEGGQRNYYGIGSSNSPSPHNGFGGAWWTVSFLDGQVVETCDLWGGGPIPDRWYERLPVTAKLRSGKGT